MIDSDEKAYTVDILKGWKEKAEKRAEKAIENPRIVNIGPDFADTIVLVTRQTCTRQLDLSGKNKQGRKRRRIDIKPINVKRDLIGPKIPLVFKQDLITAGQCLFVVSCQNQGSGIDHYVKIGVSFATSAIVETIIDNSSQIQILRGGNPTSSFVRVMIRDLLPGEIQSFQLIAKDSIPITIELWTQNSGKSDEIYIFDVEIGDDEIIK